MAEIIDGKLLAQKIRNELKEKVIKENLHPYLAVILCGDDEASKVKHVMRMELNLKNIDDLKKQNRKKLLH